MSVGGQRNVVRVRLFSDAELLQEFAYESDLPQLVGVVGLVDLGF